MPLGDARVIVQMFLIVTCSPVAGLRAGNSVMLCSTSGPRAASLSAELNCAPSREGHPRRAGAVKARPTPPSSRGVKFSPGYSAAYPSRRAMSSARPRVALAPDSCRPPPATSARRPPRRWCPDRSSPTHTRPRPARAATRRASQYGCPSSCAQAQVSGILIFRLRWPRTRRAAVWPMR